MIKAAFFDTKSYDRKYFENAHGAEKLAMRLLVFPNVLITAHQAFLTHEALTELARVLCGEPAIPRRDAALRQPAGLQSVRMADDCAIHRPAVRGPLRAIGAAAVAGVETQPGDDEEDVAVAGADGDPPALAARAVAAE